MNEQQRKAMELAFEALEAMQNAIYNIGGEHVQDLGYALEKADVAELAITTIKEALAQPEQEPVAWMYPDALCDKACLYLCTKGFTQFPECATTPPQRTWVGLTDREKSNLWLESRAAVPRFYTYASLVEAKLKEKNT